MRTRDVEVEIYFLPSEHGGRRGPAFRGYRPQFYYRGHDWDAVYEYPDSEAVMPGETARAYLSFLSPTEHVGKVAEGMPFLIREGNRTVGYGSVRTVLGLPRSANSDGSPT